MPHDDASGARVPLGGRALKKYIGQVSFVFSTAQGRVLWETFSSLLIQQMLLTASWVLGTSHCPPGASGREGDMDGQVQVERLSSWW